MFGNGYCARSVDMDCHFESIWESCAFFVTTIDLRPTLQRRRDDAAQKGQRVRQKIVDELLRGATGELGDQDLLDGSDDDIRWHLANSAIWSFGRLGWCVVADWAGS